MYLIEKVAAGMEMEERRAEEKRPERSVLRSVKQRKPLFFLLCWSTPC